MWASSILHWNLFRIFLFQALLKADINCRELMLQMKEKNQMSPFALEIEDVQPKALVG